MFDRTGAKVYRDENSPTQKDLYLIAAILITVILCLIILLISIFFAKRLRYLLGRLKGAGRRGSESGWEMQVPPPKDKEMTKSPSTRCWMQSGEQGTQQNLEEMPSPPPMPREMVLADCGGIAQTAEQLISHVLPTPTSPYPLHLGTYVPATSSVAPRVSAGPSMPQTPATSSWKAPVEWELPEKAADLPKSPNTDLIDPEEVARELGFVKAREDRREQ